MAPPFSALLFLKIQFLISKIAFSIYSAPPFISAWLLSKNDSLKVKFLVFSIELNTKIA